MTARPRAEPAERRSSPSRTLSYAGLGEDPGFLLLLARMAGLLTVAISLALALINGLALLADLLVVMRGGTPVGAARGDSTWDVVVQGLLVVAASLTMACVGFLVLLMVEHLSRQRGRDWAR